MNGKPDIPGQCSCGRPCKECEAFERCGGCKHPIICPVGGECHKPELILLDVFKGEEGAD